jgi:thiamine pyrophosphokinase
VASPDTVVVFSGGPAPLEAVLASIPSGAPVLAADRGAAHALALGLRVSHAVGDFDSLAPAALAALERSGARLERHPAAKDVTDLELALEAAAALQPRRILVVGSGAGRLDHALGELLLLGAPAYAGVEVDALLGRSTVHVIRGERRLSGAPAELISLFPLHGEARGVVSEGLVYPLAGEVLRAGGSRGVSNMFDTAQARVSLRSGVLLAVRPGRRASAAALRNARRSVRGENASS